MKVINLPKKLVDEDISENTVKKKYGSDLIIDSLIQNAIEYIAFNPGSSINPLQDSIVNYDSDNKPELILCCHEEIAAAIAHGYAKASGKMMAIATHANVGLMHASMAIFNAWCDRVPMLVIGGVGPLDADKRRPWIDWLHSSNTQANIVSDFVKWHDQPHSLSAAVESIHRACKIAKTAPNAPVYLGISTTLQEEKIESITFDPQGADKFQPPKKPHASQEDLENIADLLMEATAPVIMVDYFGNHCPAVDDLVKLSELLGVAVIDGCNRYNFPTSHPLWVAGGEHQILSKADFLLSLDVQDLYGALGSFNNSTKNYNRHLNPEAFIAHITLNDYLISSWAADYQRLCPVNLTIAADSSHAVDKLLCLCKKRLTKDIKKHSARRFESIKKHNQFWREKSELAAMEVVEKRLTVPSSLQMMWKLLKNENFIIANCGGLTVRTWIKKLWKFDNNKSTFIGNSTGGAGLGYGMGAAIGVAIALKGMDKLCISIQNDGDLLYTPSALWTAAHHRIPLLIIVMNNRSYGLVERLSANVAARRNRDVHRSHIGNSFENPPIHFPDLAKSFGVLSFKTIRNKEDLSVIMPKAIAHVKERREPVLIEINLK